MKESPNWLEMPDELIVNILQRVGTIEIFKNIRKVCKTWRRIYMWNVIVMHKSYDGGDEWDANHVLERLTMKAVYLSGGELTDISIKGFGNDDLLDCIVQQSSKLKRLCLGDNNVITGSALIRAVKRVPQLEKLHLSYTNINAEDIEVIGRNCPQLKFFKISKLFMKGPHHCDDNAFAIANSMPELRHLELNDKEMTNDGLKVILNGCPHIEYLDVGWCLNIWLEDELERMCRERIKTIIYDSSD